MGNRPSAKLNESLYIVFIRGYLKSTPRIEAALKFTETWESFQLRTSGYSRSTQLRTPDSEDEPQPCTPFDSIVELGIIALGSIFRTYLDKVDRSNKLAPLYGVSIRRQQT